MNNKLIDELLHEIGSIAVPIENIHVVLNRFAGHFDETDIPIDRYDLNEIVRMNDTAFIAVTEYRGAKASSLAMQAVIEKMDISCLKIGGLIVYYMMNPEYPFMEISESMDIVHDSVKDDMIILGVKRYDNIPIDFVQILMIAVENKGSVPANGIDYQNR